MRRRAADRPSTPIDLAHDIWRFHANASACCGRLHAYRRGTRRKYVLVGSGAASMPLKVPRRHPRKHHRLLSVAERNAEGLLGRRCFGMSPSLTMWQRIDGLPICIGHGLRRHPHVLESIACRSAIAILGAWCRVRWRDRVATWMSPPSLQGRIHGVSRHWMRRRAADQLRTPINLYRTSFVYARMLRSAEGACTRTSVGHAASTSM
ncbi:UNVERIFIED_ORG: hypothetical protein FHT06_000832 [Xanthomonas campestris]